MIYVHCKGCDHEWECTNNDKDSRICNWCGGDSYILEGEISTSEILKMVGITNKDVIQNLEELNNKYADKVIKKIKKHSKD